MRPSTNTHRPGITRLEVALLVLLALVTGGIAAVFLSRSWANANRIRCTQNLKQMGEACVRFHEVRKFLPASCIAKGYGTWAVQIAPFLNDADADLLTDWDESLPFYQQPESVRTKLIEAYFCPARARSVFVTRPGVHKPGDDKATYPGSLGDYACSVGTNSKGHFWSSESANGAIILAKVVSKDQDRILKWKGQITLEDLQKLRGTSSTILVGEKHVPWGKLGDFSAGDGCIYNGGYPAHFSRIGGPGFPVAEDVTAPYRTNFGSYHPDVCGFLMADGSTQWLNDDISAQVLGQLTNRFPE